MLKKIKISYFFIKRNQGSIMFSLDALVWIIHSRVKEFKRAKPKIHLTNWPLIRYKSYLISHQN